MRGLTIQRHLLISFLPLLSFSLAVYRCCGPLSRCPCAVAAVQAHEASPRYRACVWACVGGGEYDSTDSVDVRRLKLIWTGSRRPEERFLANRSPRSLELGSGLASIARLTSRPDITVVLSTAPLMPERVHRARLRAILDWIDLFSYQSLDCDLRG